MNVKKVVLAGLVLVIIILPLLARFLVVSSVSCSSQFGPCDQSLDAIASDYSGKSIFFAKSKIIDILDKSPLVEEYSLTILFTKIQVHVIERNGYVALSDFEDSDKVLIMDESGLIIKESTNTALPTLFTQLTNLTIGAQVDEQIVFAARLLASLADSYRINTGEIATGGLKVKLPDTVTAIFPLSGDEDIILGSLRLLLSRLKPIQTGTTIDLRYKNPVVRQIK